VEIKDQHIELPGRAEVIRRAQEWLGYWATPVNVGYKGRIQRREAIPPMSEDEYTDRVVRIMRDLYDLKEDVLFDKNMRQPEFDAGHP
jgi:hypothetical protein